MAETRKPFHREVADRLIEQIKAGTAPWQKPWVPGFPIMPTNPTTGKRYKGVNTLMLMMNDYADNRWMTYNQAQKAGFSVKKGEHGTPVQYWVLTERINKLNPVTGEPELDAKGKPVKVEVELEKPKVMISYVFNAQQIDGIPPLERQTFAWNPHQRAEDILHNGGVTVTHAVSNDAAYSPSQDVIHLPDKSQFPDAEKYYGTGMHELAHATGHESRLNRDINNPFGSTAYAREELVAEISTMMLCGEIGIAADPNRNAAYVNSWVQDLQDHPMEICKAAMQADRVLNYVIDLERERVKERSPELEESWNTLPYSSPKFEIAYFKDCRQALNDAIERPENVHVFEHDGQKLFASKTTETLYSVPSHAPTAGENFDIQTDVYAYDGAGRQYAVRMQETLCRQADGGNEVVSPKAAVEVTPRNREVMFPLNWTGELSVRGCAEDKDGNVRSLGLAGGEIEFYGIYAKKEDGTEQHIKDYDKLEHARDFAEGCVAEYQTVRGLELEMGKPDPDQLFIKIPYTDRTEARARGAEWDKDAKSWYVPKGGEPGKLTEKWPLHDPEKTNAELEAKAKDRATRSEGKSQNKMYINVPKAEKDTAKELGARWDRQALSWYVPSGVNPDPLTVKWPMHEPATLVAKSTMQREPKQMESKPKRLVLAVPYREKEAAKAAGARWDSEGGVWFADAKADRIKLEKWLVETRIASEPTMTPREEFAQVLKRIGAVVTGEHPIMDKAPHRIEVADDHNGEKSGFYIGHPDGHPAGYAKNNRSQEEVHWTAKGYILDNTEKKALQDKANDTLAKRDAELEKQYARTAAKLHKQLANLEPVTSPTPYLANKGVQVQAGIFASGKTTCIPVHDATGAVKSVQYIQVDGTKRFAKNSSREGYFHAVGGMNALKKAPVIVISEGYATATSVSQALGHATVAAFDAGNLVSVAKALRKAMPDKAIILAGDDDRHLEAAGKINVGKVKAQEAAAAVNGKAVFPVFAPRERDSIPKAFTDFNDLASRSKLGLEAVKSQIGSVIRLRLEKRASEIERAKTQERGKGGKEISRV